LDVNERYIEQFMAAKDSLIYDIGQPAEVFYIVREGELVLETILEYEETLKFPVDAKSWELRRTTKTMQYKIRNLT